MSVQSFAADSSGWARVWAPLLATRSSAVCGVDGHRCAFCRMTVEEVEAWRKQHGGHETKGKR